MTATALAHHAAEVGICEEHPERLFHLHRGPGQEARTARDDRLRGSARSAGHDRQAGGRGFEERNAKALHLEAEPAGSTGLGEHRCSSEPGSDLVVGEVLLDGEADVSALGPPPQRGLLAPGADEKETTRPVLQARHRVDEDVLALAGNEPADTDHVRRLRVAAPLLDRFDAHTQPLARSSGESPDPAGSELRNRHDRGSAPQRTTEHLPQSRDRRRHQGLGTVTQHGVRETGASGNRGPEQGGRVRCTEHHDVRVPRCNLAEDPSPHPRRGEEEPPAGMANNRRSEFGSLVRRRDDPDIMRGPGHEFSEVRLDPAPVRGEVVRHEEDPGHGPRGYRHGSRVRW